MDWSFMVQAWRGTSGRLTRSYGGGHARYQPRRRNTAPEAGRHAALVAAVAVLLSAVPLPAWAKTLRLAAFGDSLMAGYGLHAGADFPARLEAALRKDGFDVAIINASVSGDTTSGGIDRLDWSIPEGTDGVLLELGANDMLRGQDPGLTRGNLTAMVDRLQARHIAVFLLGMRASPTLGADFATRFDAIYPDLAKDKNLPLYPFFLDGVVAHANLQLPDGMHPNPDGVAVMVNGVLAGVEAWLKQLMVKT